jgi:mannose-1-phosphate guanylyltransferase (GDP) (EC 2.7.7.22)
MTNHLIIMAGGVGSRFWPMSTPEKPKQFIDVLGVGRSLLQLTVDRFGDLFYGRPHLDCHLGSLPLCGDGAAARCARKKISSWNLACAIRRPALAMWPGK